MSSPHGAARRQEAEPAGGLASIPGEPAGDVELLQDGRVPQGPQPSQDPQPPQDPQPHQDVELHQDTERHHRTVQRGWARAAVFGVSDGLVTNVSLILGVAGAQPGASYIRLAGLAGLLAGAFSMAAGEYVSMSAQRELLARELEVERRALINAPEAEFRELAELYERRGLPPEAASYLAQMMMRTPELALEAHAREEIGIDPSTLGSPYLAALTSLVSFMLGAAIPLAPWFFLTGAPAVAASVSLVAVASILAGLVLSRATGRSPARSAFRQLAVSMLAAGLTYLIGRLIGVSVLH
jgi:vacuolar iron transporter family protein